MGRVIFANLPGWTGTSIKETDQVTCSLPNFVDNDMNIAALGEGWVGSAQGLAHYVFITLGSGIGGSLIHDHHVIHSSNGGARKRPQILYPGGIPCN